MKETMDLECTISPLKFMSTVGVVFNAYRQRSVCDIMGKLQGKHFRCWSEYTERARYLQVEKVVRKEMEKIVLPSIIRNNIYNLIMPIGVEIMLYKDFCEYDLNIDEQHWDKIVYKLCWTMLGTIDHVQTAKAIVKDETFDIKTRYAVACCNCLKEDIIRLYDEVPNKKAEPSEFMKLWSLIIEEKTNELEFAILKSVGWSCSRAEYGLRLASKRGHVAAVKYFLKELTPEEKDKSIVEMCKVACRNCYLSCRPYHKDICFLLFSELTKSQWEEIFSSHSKSRFAYCLLLCFLKWPREHLFMKAVNTLWSVMTLKVYQQLVDDIAYLCSAGFNYQQIWRDFWLMSPVEYKHFVLDGYTLDGHYLHHIFNMGDLSNIQLLLKEATPVQKWNLISCFRGLKLCEYLINEKKIKLLDYFINECLETKEELVQFKQEVQRERPPPSKRWFSQFINLLDLHTVKFGQNT